MARGGLEAAVWDLAARLRWRAAVEEDRRRRAPRNPLRRLASAFRIRWTQLLEKIERELADGYQRIKIKIKPGWDVDVVRRVRERFPSIKLMADANSAYTLADADHLRKLDDFYLMMIEQPLATTTSSITPSCRRNLQTPICLDECIRIAHHAEQAIKLRACGIINIKLGRVGGFREAQARARCGAGRGHSGLVRRHAGSRHRPRAQHRALHAAEFRAAGRCFGQQALLEARHHPARRWRPRRAAPSTSRDEPGFGYALDLDYLRGITVREETVG